MGNRSVIVIKSENNDSDIVIYGHWSGDSNVQAVRNVLSTTGRIGDNYLVAEIFHEFAVKLGGFTGVGYGSFGMWTSKGGEDLGWEDAPTVYVNQDDGSYEYQGIHTTFAELKASPSPEPDVIY
jgi:hypothetical protein